MTNLKIITIGEGAQISAAEVERVEKAIEQLKEDKGATREMTVTVTLHLHHEYPKVVYKGKEHKAVANADEEAAAAGEGFGVYDHKAFTAKEA